ncbi:MAG: Tll0287-like domain-containing protein, partial [Nitrospiraceae bacterium]
TNVVDALQDKVQAEEHWKQQKALPLPAQMILDGGKLVAEKGTGIKYRLASVTPIYVWNAPATDFERKGLEAVTKNPDKPFTGFIRIGRDRFFQAIYADRAISQACVKCHNTHLNSPKKDYRLNDVMGGIIITIPVSNK